MSCLPLMDGVVVLGPSGSRKIERLLETHGVDFRLPARNKRFAFDLIQPIATMKYGDVRVTAARPRDAELPAVGPADSVRDIELDQAPFRHLLYCVAHQSVFPSLVSRFRHFRDGQREYAGYVQGGVGNYKCVE